MIDSSQRKIEPETMKRSLLAIIVTGLMSGLLGGIAMLCTMGALRIAFGWPTPTELIFDRIFPKLTVEFFISSRWASAARRRWCLPCFGRTRSQIMRVYRQPSRAA